MEKKHHSKGELSLHDLIQKARKGGGKKKIKRSCKYRKTPKRKLPPGKVIK